MVGSEDSRGVISASLGGRVGRVIGGGVVGIGGDVDTERVHLEASGYHYVIYS